MTLAPAIVLSGEARLANALLFNAPRFELMAGAWTSLLGASGVGKTTLLRLVAGLETAAAFCGTITASDGLTLEGRIAFMGQSDLLAPWLDVLGNVTLGARLRGRPHDLDRAQDILARVGLSRHAHQRPHMLSCCWTSPFRRWMRAPALKCRSWPGNYCRGARCFWSPMIQARLHA